MKIIISLAGDLDIVQLDEKSVHRRCTFHSLNFTKRISSGHKWYTDN